MLGRSRRPAVSAVPASRPPLPRRWDSKGLSEQGPLRVPQLGQCDSRAPARRAPTNAATYPALYSRSSSYLPPKLRPETAVVVDPLSSTPPRTATVVQRASSAHRPTHVDLQMKAP